MMLRFCPFEKGKGRLDQTVLINSDSFVIAASAEGDGCVFMNCTHMDEMPSSLLFRPEAATPRQIVEAIYNAAARGCPALDLVEVDEAYAQRPQTQQ